MVSMDGDDEEGVVLGALGGRVRPMLRCCVCNGKHEMAAVQCRRQWVGCWVHAVGLGACPMAGQWDLEIQRCPTTPLNASGATWRVEGGRIDGRDLAAGSLLINEWW
jgi:hypothetical protein